MEMPRCEVTPHACSTALSRWADRFESMLPKFEAYIATLGDFKRNHFNSLTADVSANVRKRWARSFVEFGYS